MTVIRVELAEEPSPQLLDVTHHLAAVAQLGELASQIYTLGLDDSPDPIEVVSEGVWNRHPSIAVIRVRSLRMESPLIAYLECAAQFAPLFLGLLNYSVSKKAKTDSQIPGLSPAESRNLDAQTAILLEKHPDAHRIYNQLIQNVPITTSEIVDDV